MAKQGGTLGEVVAFMMHWAGQTRDFMTSSTNHIPVMGWELDAQEMLGVSTSQLRFALSLFAAVWAGAGLHLIKSPRLRHLYSLVTGLAVVYYPFGQSVVNLLPPALVTYLAMWLLPRKCGAIAWGFTFPYLIILHVLAASGLSWAAGSMDFTGGMMVAVLKIISTAVCYQDFAAHKRQRAKGQVPNRYQELHAVAALPSLFEYMAYLFGFGNLLGGPYIEFKDYKDFIDHTGKWSPTALPRPVPAPWATGVRLVGESLCFLTAYLSIEPRWGPPVQLTPWFRAQPLLHRMAAMWSLGIVYQLRYFFVWKLSEASLQFAGLNFQEWKADGTPVWGRYCNCNFLGVQLADSARLTVANWNIQTGNFLRRYVYERLGKPSFLHLLITQIVSGIWHGLYPGYFLTFVSSAMWLHNSTVIYKWQSYLPSTVARSWAWHVVKVVWTNMFLNYIAQAFIALLLDNSFKVWSSVYFIPHLLALAMAALSFAFPGKRDDRALRGVAKNAATSVPTKVVAPPAPAGDASSKMD